MSTESPDSTKHIGRTFWDLLHERLGRPMLLAVLSIISLLLIVVTAFAAHFAAEPGTEVTIFAGLSKYKKPGLAPTPTPTPEDDPAKLQLCQSERLLLKDEVKQRDVTLTSEREALATARRKMTAQDEQIAVLSTRPASCPWGGGSLAASTPTAANSAKQAEISVSDFDGEWWSPKHKYGFDLRSGLGKATISNSAKFAPGDRILRIERVANRRFYGEQVFTNGAWVKVSGQLLDQERLEMNGGGLIWVMEKR
jgi:hypothetical protein